MRETGKKTIFEAVQEIHQALKPLGVEIMAFEGSREIIVREGGRLEITARLSFPPNDTPAEAAQENTRKAMSTPAKAAPAPGKGRKTA
jgi:hypothetical protein